MADITMTTLEGALKNFYLPGINNQLREGINAFYAAIETNGEEVEGSTIKMAMKYGRTGGVGNRAENGATPTPGFRPITQVEYPTKNLFGTVRFTDKMMDVGNTQKGAFVNVVDNAMEDTMNDLKDSFGRQLFMDGVGKLATCSAGGPALTVVVDSIQYLCEGMFIDVMAANNTVKYSCRKIEVVDMDTDTITLDTTGGNVTVLATDWICVSGNYNQELTGLDSIFQPTGTIYGKDRAANKWLVPNFNNVAGEIDEIWIQKGLDIAWKRAGGKINFMIGSDGVLRAYQYYMGAYKRNTETMQLKGGYTVISYNGIPLDKDPYCQAGVLWQLVKEDFKIHQMGDYAWMNKDGTILHKVSGYPFYEATLKKYGDLGCRKPAAQTKSYGIIEH